MLFNKLMESILKGMEINTIQPQNEYPIWQEANCDGQPFWCVGNFCGLSESIIESDCDLTELEWDGNEIYICNSKNISELVTNALGIITAWKVQMEREYSDIPFDIFLSVDNGDEDVMPSVTLRFWAVRNEEHYIAPLVSEFEEFSQPVLMEQINI